MAIDIKLKCPQCDEWCDSEVPYSTCPKCGFDRESLRQLAAEQGRKGIASQIENCNSGTPYGD